MDKKIDLQFEINQELSKIKAEIIDLPWTNKQFYLNWLCQSYYYVSHSSQLLALCAAYAKDLNQHKFFLKHTNEEKGHEVLASNDLKKLGYNELPYKENIYTQAFWQTQFYQIQHLRPTAFYGYAMFLEALVIDVGPQILNTLEKHFPQGSYSFLKVHCHEDLGHVDENYKILNSLSELEKNEILNNFKMSKEIYMSMLRSISNRNQIKQTDFSNAA